jgi:hypothetical protein
VTNPPPPAETVGLRPKAKMNSTQPNPRMRKIMESLIDLMGSNLSLSNNYENENSIFQAPIFKIQKPNKFQISMIETPNHQVVLLRGSRVGLIVAGINSQSSFIDSST